MLVRSGRAAHAKLRDGVPRCGARTSARMRTAPMLDTRVPHIGAQAPQQPAGRGRVRPHPCAPAMLARRFLEHPRLRVAPARLMTATRDLIENSLVRALNPACGRASSDARGGQVDDFCGCRCSSTAGGPGEQTGARALASGWLRRAQSVVRANDEPRLESASLLSLVIGSTSFVSW
jgi:hypothetical protein